MTTPLEDALDHFLSWKMPVPPMSLPDNEYSDLLSALVRLAQDPRAYLTENGQ